MKTASPRAWLVDENAMTRHITTTILGRHAFEVSPFANGIELVAALSNGNQGGPDILLIDGDLTLVDTRDTIGYIRDVLQLHVPVIVLGTMPTPGSPVGVPKPIIEAVLIHAIQEAFEPAFHDEETMPLFSLSNLENIARNNPAFVQRMIDLFSQQTPLAVEEMEIALRDKDFKRVSAVAHRIKPTLDNMGITLAKNVVRKLESLGKTGDDEFIIGGLVFMLCSICRKVVEKLARVRRDDR